MRCNLDSAPSQGQIQTIATAKPTQDDHRAQRNMQVRAACDPQAGSHSATGKPHASENRSPDLPDYARTAAGTRLAACGEAQAGAADLTDSADADVNIATVTAAGRRKQARTHATRTRGRAVSASSDTPNTSHAHQRNTNNTNTQQAGADGSDLHSPTGPVALHAHRPIYTSHHTQASSSAVPNVPAQCSSSADGAGLTHSTPAYSTPTSTAGDGATDASGPSAEGDFRVTTSEATHPSHNHEPDVTLEIQKADPKLAAIIDYLQNGTLPADDKFARRICITSDQYAILNGRLCHLGTQRRKRNSTDQPVIEQVCIPVQLQPTVIAQYHEQFLHAGIEKLYLSIKQRVYWDQMYTDIRRYVSECDTCKRAKANNHPIRAPVQCRDVPPNLFQRIHIDHVQINVKGAKHGFTHALVIVDAMSLCSEFVPVKSTTAAETCQAIITHWIARYGCFSELISDRAKSFTGKLTQLLAQRCGIKHILVSSHNSKSNGLAEKSNGMLLQGLRLICQNRTDWPDLLPMISAAYRASVLPSRGYIPFRILYGQEMKLPVETALNDPLPAHMRPSADIDKMSEQLKIMRANAQELAQKNREKYAKRINTHRRKVVFRPGDRVYKLREVLGDTEDRKTAPRFIGPFVVLDSGSHDTYQLAHLHTGRTLKSRVHVDKLRTTAHNRAAKRGTNAVNTINALSKHTITHAPPKRGAGCRAARPRLRREAQRPLSPLPPAGDHPETQAERPATSDGSTQNVARPRPAPSDDDHQAGKEGGGSGTSGAHTAPTATPRASCRRRQRRQISAQHGAPKSDTQTATGSLSKTVDSKPKGQRPETDTSGDARLRAPHKRRARLRACIKYAVYRRA